MIKYNKSCKYRGFNQQRSITPKENQVLAGVSVNLVMDGWIRVIKTTRKKENPRIIGYMIAVWETFTGLAFENISDRNRRMEMEET